ncbi:MAG: hypothetical protein Q7R95_07145, partial [bacterium]|nr:hypothetical protein [bacterium]
MNFETYTQLSDDLFNNWNEDPENSGSKFTWDGVVAENEDDWNKWQNSRSKVLFLTKEAHSDYVPNEPC